jgi:hypothetical protein
MKTNIFIVTFLLSVSVYADSNISVKILEITNIARGESMEVCGEAKHSEGIRPLLVTVSHDVSKYTTLTGQDGKWCTVIRRWNFIGKVTATASTLDFSVTSEKVLNEKPLRK